jgi:hypothetical protein
MLGALVVSIVLALAGIFISMVGMFRETTYGKELENYIINRNPQTPGDVERYAIDFQRKQERNFL